MPLDVGPIVIDTKEKEPWSFSGVDVVKAHLEVGDYSVAGLESRCAVERKSLDDFAQTLGTRARRRRFFERHVEPMARMDAAAVVVEAELDRLLLHRYATDATPASLLATAASLTVDWRVPVFFLGSRAAAAAWTREFLLRFARRASGSGTPLGFEPEPESEPASTSAERHLWGRLDDEWTRLNSPTRSSSPGA